MLNFGQMKLLQYITNECSLKSKVYKRMKVFVGVPRAIYFRLNMSKYYKLHDGADLMWLTIVLLELQNPKLQHIFRDDYVFKLKQIVTSLSIEDQNTINNHFETLIYGKN